MSDLVYTCFCRDFRLMPISRSIEVALASLLESAADVGTLSITVSRSKHGLFIRATGKRLECMPMLEPECKRTVKR